MTAEPYPDGRVRLAELVALMSLGADLGLGQPMEHALRQCLLALRIGERLGLSPEQRGDLYYLGLLAWVGCHVDAYEQAKWFGDDIRMKRDIRYTDFAGAQRMRFMATHVGAERTGVDRARTTAAFLARGRRDADAMITNHWYAADDLAGRLGLSDDVRRPLFQTFERWDGKGLPTGTKGEANLLAARIVALCDVLAVYHRAGGHAAALEIARARRGTQFDPGLVDLVRDAGPPLFDGLDDVATWDVVIAAEPVLGRTLRDAELETAFEALADFTDTKSPHTLGHSRGVAALAARAADLLGLAPPDVTHVRRAALVHDLGRLGVSNAVWDKNGPLSSGEEERVRLHPYLSERMLASAGALRSYGATAAQHHERLDGSGYPRGVRGEGLTLPGRILAAADAYHGKLEPRPHRPAKAPREAASWARAEVRAGRLDGPAVDAVLEAAGHAVRRRKEWPAGLTSREVEVLRLLARGLQNRQIADRLVISRRTADNHVEHIYTKIGVSNRARASLFAVKHGLMTAADEGVFTS
jgi:HD-GYP domain-containing protein (c-di-GMP phosphodiesterase class II)